MIERQENGGGPRDSFASWRRDGEPPRYVPATTMCVSPRLPHRLRARREGFETTIRCGDCPGCREFEVLRLERRLVQTYAAIVASADDNGCRDRAQVSAIPKKIAPRLSAVRIYCPAEMHASMSRRIHRWRGVEIEPGFFRAGVDSFIVLSREHRELVARLRRRRFRVHAWPVKRLDRQVSWRAVARGLIVARSAYGENINRYYRRGLAPAAREHFEVVRINEYKRFDRARDPRATSERLGDLVPAEVLEVRRGFRLRMRNAFRFATTPEAVDSIMPEVLALVRRVAKPLVVSAVPKSAEEIERSRRAYQHVARLEMERSADPRSQDSPSLSFEGRVTELLDNSSSQIGRPMSSIHSSGAPPPRTRDSIKAEAEAVEAAEKARKDFHAQRTKKKLDDALNRLRELVEKRGER